MLSHNMYCYSYYIPTLPLRFQFNWLILIFYIQYNTTKFAVPMRIFGWVSRNSRLIHNNYSKSIINFMCNLLLSVYLSYFSENSWQFVLELVFNHLSFCWWRIKISYRTHTLVQARGFILINVLYVIIYNLWVVCLTKSEMNNLFELLE